MQMAMKKDLGPGRDRAEGRLLCFALLPLFLVAEGVHRAERRIERGSGAFEAASMVR